ALMRGIPHMRVVCPADEDELAAALPAVVGGSDPCYIRYNACPAPVVHAPFQIGVAESVSGGEDVAILTYGFLLTGAGRAVCILQARGTSVRLVNLRTVKPIDEQAIIDAATSTGMVVTLEDHFLSGGLYTAVAEILVRRGIRCPVTPMALEERWFRPA